jgi:acyl-CoA thioester hydrolase
MADFRFTYQIEVRFRDCDPMGHVNNAVYLTYLEQVRLAYWRELTRGRTPRPGMILARMECDYRTPATVGQLLDVRMRVFRIGRTSFECEYEIVDTRDRHLVAQARSVQVVYDYAAGKPVPMPDEVRERIEDFEGRTLASPRHTEAT